MKALSIPPGYLLAGWQFEWAYDFLARFITMKGVARVPGKETSSSCGAQRRAMNSALDLSPATDDRMILKAVVALI